MTGRVFSREREVALRAHQLLEGDVFKDDTVRRHYADLVAEYEKLSRQGTRLLKMGDRIQGLLNDLNLKLQISEQKYRGIFKNAVEGIFRCDLSDTLVEVNPAMASMLGYASAEEMLESVEAEHDLFCNHDDFRRYVETLARERSVKRFQAEMLHRNGGSVWVEISAGMLCSDDGESAYSTGVVGVVADITERKRMMEEMCRLARTDSLTGLWNRGYFVELSRRELARCRRGGYPLSVLLIDVDHFKKINDTFGHDVGDKALVALAGAMRNSLREIDILGRFGGEEFVVLLPDVCRKGACVVAERIRKQIGTTLVDAGSRDVNMTVSIGATFMDDDSIDLDGLLKHADMALYRAKNNGRDRVELHHGS